MQASRLGAFGAILLVSTAGCGRSETVSVTAPGPSFADAVDAFEASLLENRVTSGATRSGTYLPDQPGETRFIERVGHDQGRAIEPDLGALLRRCEEFARQHGLVHATEQLAVGRFGELPEDADPAVPTPTLVVDDDGERPIGTSPRGRYLRIDLPMAHELNQSLRYVLSLTIDRLDGTLFVDSFLRLHTPCIQVPSVWVGYAPNWRIE
jgi:hypothetical protein